MLRLKQLRKQRGLNQTGLAIKLNISQSTISSYEKGDRSPDSETLLSIANFFDVSLDYLVGISDIKKPITKSDLSADELENLYTYRQLSSFDKEKMEAYIAGMRHDLK